VSKITEFRNNFKKNHPIFSKILFVFFWGLILYAIIIPYILAPVILPPISFLLPFTDNVKPEIEGISPNINERFIEPPKEIQISFREDGGSGIDKENSNVALRGATTGDIEKKSIEYTEGLITFIPNQLLEPDAYTIYTKLRDKGGNVALNSYSFYVLENPILNISINELEGQIKEWWSNYLNMSYEQYNYYLLLVSNQDNVFLENVRIDVQFPGVIIDYSVQEDNGNYGYSVKIGEGNIFLGVETTNITSCCSKIYIKEIAPGGDLLVVYYVDLEIEKYDNAMWCRPGIFDSDWIFTSDFENEYTVSYDYQEYGYWYQKNATGNISQINID